MRSRFLFTLCVLCVTRGEMVAAPPVVESIWPGAGQRGKEFTLTLAGSQLTNPQELLFYTPGVTCAKLAARDKGVVATLVTSPDCRLGEHAFRLRTSGGLSELRTLHITRFPVIEEMEPNDSAMTAQAMTMNVTVAGVIEATGTDHFTVTLKKGQRLAAEVEAIRLGVDTADAVVTVFGPDGTELATNDDNPLFYQDPFVTLVAPVDGVYRVVLREANYGGGDSSRYLLHIGTFCRPASVFPAGGQAGTEVGVKLLGDAAGERTLSLKLPPVGTPYELYPQDGETPPAPTANPFRVSPFPNVIEGTQQAANASVWPVAFNGVLAKPNEADLFRFIAKKGDAIDVTAFAYRIGSPLDTVIEVLHSNGELLRISDDDDTHDSLARVFIPADGEYMVRVTDKRRQGGPAFIYRIELTEAKPGLAVFLAGAERKSQLGHVVTVPRGNRVQAFFAVRRDSISGSVTLTASELPAGVTLGLRPIPADEYLLPVVFEAAPDAPLGAKLVSLAGTCKGVTGNFTDVVMLVRGPGDSSLHSVSITQLAVVVVDPVPFSVTVVPPTVPLGPDGTLDVTVKVSRSQGFTAPLDLYFPALPPGIETPVSVNIPADKTDAVVTLVASPQAELGDWQFIAEARVARTGRGGRDPLQVGMNGLGTGGEDGQPAPRQTYLPVASAITPIRVTESPVTGKFADAAVEQGKLVTVVCRFEAPLAAPFTAKLDGLPPRATAQPLELAVGAKQAEFAVVVESTVPTGLHDSLVCELTGTLDGQRVVYRLSRGGKLKIDAPGGVKTDETGKPLSPLDALRQKQKDNEKKPKE